MIVTRRGFLSSILALGVAPAIVRADSLMRIVPRETGILVADQDFTLGDEESLEWATHIDVTTLMSTSKEYVYGLPLKSANRK